MSLKDPKGIVKTIRDWLAHDTLRRADEKAHPYSKGFDDGWDAAREEIAGLLRQEANAATAR
jgi:hypothetical protein